jgi:hypothetical protein
MKAGKVWRVGAAESLKSPEILAGLFSNKTNGAEAPRA